MKNLFVTLIAALSISAVSLAGVSISGATGTVDFPNAYNLRISNYTVSGNIDGLDKESTFGIMLEGGFIPQVEAGIKISNKQFKIDEKLLKANFKFQFVQEADNPALALGFTEEDNNVYGYLVATKSFKDMVQKDSNVTLSAGMTYNSTKNVNAFGTVDFPIYQKIKLLGEVFSYQDALENNKSKVSFSVGGDFYTTNDIRTKVYWRENGGTLGVSISYLGIYK